MSKNRELLKLITLMEHFIKYTLNWYKVIVLEVGK